MSNQTERAYGIGRLESKTARAAIIQKISTDFNLMPIIAEAYYKQISSYFVQHADIQLTSGQICYEAVAADEPAGKHIALTRKVSCRLTLNDTITDFEMLANYGLAGLRRHRILRLTREAYDQGALLSYEDLAILLTSSPSTIKRDIRHLKNDGNFVMTRGAKHDMGPGLSHKTQIIELYLKGYQFTEIEQKTNHTERAVLRYLRDFSQVITLHQQGFPPAQIRIITNLSDKIIREYLQLFSDYKHNDRLSQLLNPQQSQPKKKEETMSIKSYKDLLIWKRSCAVVTLIYRVTEPFPKREIFGLTSQLRRAAVSVPSNIAEGAARLYTREYIRFLSNALGSIAELETQLKVAIDLVHHDVSLLPLR